MKIYLSVDMEGVVGASHWDDVDPGKPEFYNRVREQMSKEARAACLGAIDAGAKEIWVKDAHWHGRNILPEDLPKQAKLIRGWSKHPYMMVQEINSTFDAVTFVGYHSKATSGGNPLAHTLSSGIFAGIEINGELFSEFKLYAGAATLEGVPAVFLSGDEKLCQEVKKYDERIETVTTSFGHGQSTVSIQPELACDQIHAGIKKALSKDFKSLKKTLPDHFNVRVMYKRHTDAYKNSFYPGAALEDEHILRFENKNYFEVLRFLTFAMSSA